MAVDEGGTDLPPIPARANSYQLPGKWYEFALVFFAPVLRTALIPHCDGPPSPRGRLRVFPLGYTLIRASHLIFANLEILHFILPNSPLKRYSVFRMVISAEIYGLCLIFAKVFVRIIQNNSPDFSVFSKNNRRLYAKHDVQ